MEGQGSFTFGPFRLDLRDERLWRGDEVIHLSHKSLAVLRCLLAQPGQLVTKDRLFTDVWPETIVSESVLVVAIRELRRGLSDDARTPQYIETVHRRGYRFIANVAAFPPRAGRDVGKLAESHHRTNSVMTIRSQDLFVAPTPYFEQLTQDLHKTITGQPRVVFIQGEAGIGKTRLLRELQSVARQLDVEACYGRCSETLALPYFPFVESLLLSLEQACTDVITPLDADEDAIRWLRHPDQSRPLAANGFAPEQIDRDKLRLLLAVSRATLKFVQRRPICILLDDLQWADQSSLNLLEHMVFTIADAATRGPVPICLITTYRPLESASPLARFMSRLQRESICQTINLAGFDEL